MKTYYISGGDVESMYDDDAFTSLLLCLLQKLSF